jgi:hypothetical protein
MLTLKSLGHLFRRVPAIGHPLNRRDLELFRVPLSTYGAFCRGLWLRSI